MATKLEFLVAKLKVVLALATVSVAISSPGIVVSTAMWSTKFPVILGAPYNRVFRRNFHFTYLSQSFSKV